MMAAPELCIGIGAQFVVVATVFIVAFIACVSSPALLLKLDFAGINMKVRMFLHLWSQACIESLAIDRLISL